ncbi:MAG: type II toxin-antitoxin system mRNA interferase toxin, RelE/StbE family [Patescibacteria group bacterium]
MVIREVRTSSRFERHYKKLPTRVKEAAKEKEKIFRKDPFDSRLDTHKLHGKEREVWAFSIAKSYRIKFIFLREGTVLFLEAGTHDIYK